MKYNYAEYSRNIVVEGLREETMDALGLWLDMRDFNQRMDDAIVAALSGTTVEAILEARRESQSRSRIVRRSTYGTGVINFRETS